MRCTCNECRAAAHSDKTTTCPLLFGGYVYMLDLVCAQNQSTLCKAGHLSRAEQNPQFRDVIPGEPTDAE